MERMSRVGVVKADDIAADVHRALELSGGLHHCVKNGDTVLVKPNACLPIEKPGVMTNKEVVQAVIKEVKALGAEPVVGESAIHGTSTKDALKISGISRVCEEEDVLLLDFDACEREASTISYGQKTLSTYIAQPVLQCDAVIIDGTTAMEGLGPIAGDPVDMGVVVCSQDLVAADAVASFLMGFAAGEITHIEMASALGLGTSRIQSIQVAGDVESLKRLFKKPWIEAASFENITVVDGDACSGCVTECMSFLLQNKDKLKSLGRLTVVLGPKGVKKAGDVEGKILAFGNCVKDLDTDFIVEGCPPLGYDIGTVLNI